MRVEQALFTSVRSSNVQGYHLVGHTEGIRPDLAQQLSHWGPTQAALLGTHSNDFSLNFVPGGGQWRALTRTVYGGPEYSGRGGLQLVTLILAFRQEQLSGYESNPLALARTALALGHLRLPADLEQTLSPVDLPDRSLHWADSPTPNGCTDLFFLDRALELLRRQQRVAVVGLPDPLLGLEYIMSRLPAHERLQFSFTTGLKPTVQRRFDLHFLSSVDRFTLRELNSQEIVCLDA